MKILSSRQHIIVSIILFIVWVLLCDHGTHARRTLVRGQQAEQPQQRGEEGAAADATSRGRRHSVVEPKEKPHQEEGEDDGHDVVVYRRSLQTKMKMKDDPTTSPVENVAEDEYEESASSTTTSVYERESYKAVYRDNTGEYYSDLDYAYSKHRGKGSSKSRRGCGKGKAGKGTAKAGKGTAKAGKGGKQGGKSKGGDKLRMSSQGEIEEDGEYYQHLEEDEEDIPEYYLRTSPRAITGGGGVYASNYLEYSSRRGDSKGSRKSGKGSSKSSKAKKRDCPEGSNTSPPTRAPTLGGGPAPTTGAPITSTPTAKPSTATPTAKPSTATPTAKPSTATPTAKPSTATPTVKPSTATPTAKPSTATPTAKPITSPPTKEPFTCSVDPTRSWPGDADADLNGKIGSWCNAATAVEGRVVEVDGNGNTVIVDYGFANGVNSKCFPPSGFEPASVGGNKFQSADCCSCCCNNANNQCVNPGDSCPVAVACATTTLDGQTCKNNNGCCSGCCVSGTCQARGSCTRRFLLDGSTTTTTTSGVLRW